ncbi:hypothetical protein CW705_01740 [Candidatus Bathyarchaeota archaeon]|nr:MAG: hypothetical protein CW705_01740 [Candidatus Bathyarchaeota archaeon]
MGSNSNTARRIPFFLIAIITVLIALSFVTILQIFKIYKETGYADFLALTLSLSAIAFSVYMAFQIRREPLKLGFEQPKVFTVIRCSHCNYEITREFREGDYVLKEDEPCPKCKGSTFIYMIFRESEEKKKKGF